MVDMICVEDVPKRVKEIEAVGVDFIGVHVGVDQQAVGITPLEKLAEMKQCVEHSIVSVAGGINEKTLESEMFSFAYSSDKNCYVASD